MKNTFKKKMNFMKKNKSYRKKNYLYNLTKSTTTSNFEEQITVYFLEMLMMIKLFHWKTHSHPTHKATDELYDKLNKNIDRFIEVLLGKTNSRIYIKHTKSLSLYDLNSVDIFKRRIEDFKSYLVDLNDEPFIKKMSNVDLLTIRDEILADLNQFLYLLTFN